jgi:DNA uptake protein ComE-like DNA-binding protein
VNHRTRLIVRSLTCTHPLRAGQSVNVNTADAATLAKSSTASVRQAQAIVDYRQKRRLHSADDLLKSRASASAYWK